VRGTPYGFRGWTGGLNTIDSPYTISDDEARDLLNVVSTSRGAIRKRNGSTAFVSGVSSVFPTLEVTDNFNRTENPLSNGGKWDTKVPNGATTTGRTNGTLWQQNGGVNGARWNEAEQTNPAVSIETIEVAGTGAGVGLFACLSSAGTSGYEAHNGKKNLTVSRVDASVYTTLATMEIPKFEAGEWLGLAVRGGIVSVWRKKEGTWSKLVEVADSTYTKGYSGFTAGSSTKLENFTTGEMPAPATEVELTGIAPVTIESTTYLVASGGTKLYSINAAGETTEIGKSFTEGKRWSVVQAPKGTKKTGGPVYLTNGTDKPQYWSGAAKGTEVKEWVGEEGEGWYEDSGSKKHVPNGKYMVFAGNRIWMAGMSDDPAAVRFSELEPVGEGGEQADPTAWPKNNVVRFDGSDGQPITGLGVAGPYVLVFKAHKCWVIHNLDTGENRKLADTIGCVANRSIVETPQGTFFLTADQGVYLTDGSRLSEVSYKVRPTLLEATASAKENAAGGYFNNHYYLSFPKGTATKNSHTFDYDVILKSWWLHDLRGNQWALWEPVSGEPALFTTPPKEKAGVVKAFVANVYTDSGVKYVGNETLGAWWIGRWEPFAYYVMRHRVEAPFMKKNVKQLFFNGSGEIVPLVYRNFSSAGEQVPAAVGATPETEPTMPTDFSGSESLWENPDTEDVWEGELYKGQILLWGGSQATGSARMYALGVAATWSFGFGNNSAEPFEVDAFTAAVSFRKS
jgi:hypothetical protein